MKHGVDVIRHLNAAEGRDLFAALRSYLRETLQEEIQGRFTLEQKEEKLQLLRSLDDAKRALGVKEEE